MASATQQARRTAQQRLHGDGSANTTARAPTGFVLGHDVLHISIVQVRFVKERGLLQHVKTRELEIELEIG